MDVVVGAISASSAARARLRGATRRQNLFGARQSDHRRCDTAKGDGDCRPTAAAHITQIACARRVPPSPIPCRRFANPMAAISSSARRTPRGSRRTPWNGFSVRVSAARRSSGCRELGERRLPARRSPDVAAKRALSEFRPLPLELPRRASAVSVGQPATRSLENVASALIRRVQESRVSHAPAIGHRSTGRSDSDPNCNPHRRWCSLQSA
jgi:hypothetical protein